MFDSKIFIDHMGRTARRLFPNEEAEVWLYGSRARGNASENSDWDLIILLKKGEDDDESFFNYAYPFVELGWDFDQAVIPILYTQSQWDAETNTLYQNNVIKDRIRI